MCSIAAQFGAWCSLSQAQLARQSQPVSASAYVWCSRQVRGMGGGTISTTHIEASRNSVQTTVMVTHPVHVHP
jgi:hypothetical protein